jgi:hypothetical protein
MKPWKFFGKKKHIDEEKVAQEKQDLHNIRWIMDHGTDEAARAYFTGLNPDLTPSELDALMEVFHRHRSERRSERML